MPATLDKHPARLIGSLIQENKSIAYLEFSYYTYLPQTVSDERTVFKVATEEFSDERILGLMDGGQPGQELAFHSRVYARDETYMHVPMIDLSTSARAHLDKLKIALRDSLFESFKWFQSGRSFHGYSPMLMSGSEWGSFMGSLLLCNLPDRPPTVDPRWIGHRLAGGYGALRWSKNTHQYLQVPTATERIAHRK